MNTLILGARIHKRHQSRGLPGMGTRVLHLNEQSGELAKLPVMLADAQIARWQGK